MKTLNDYIQELMELENKDLPVLSIEDGGGAMYLLRDAYYPGKPQLRDIEEIRDLVASSDKQEVMVPDWVWSYEGKVWVINE